MEEQKPLWKGKTGGGSFGQKSLLIMFRFLNVRIGYFFAALAVPFYMLFDRKSYRASRNYFIKRIGVGKRIAFGHVFTNYYRFGQIIIDRFVVLARRKNIFQIEIDGQDLFKELLVRNGGFVMVSSHVGNFELLGYLYPQNRKRIYSMTFEGESAVIQKARSRQLDGNNIRMVTASKDLNHIFTINNALSEGNIVSFPADRVFGSRKSIACRFLNGTAEFPIGPFMLPAINDVPVLAAFVMKSSAKKYKLYLKPITGNVAPESGSKAKAEALTRHFVLELERIAQLYPEQWFNFYPFWKED